jgi:hypothetical protein
MNMIAKTVFLACVCVASFVNANGTEMKEVNFSGKFLCPVNEELHNLEAVVPPPGRQSDTYEEWAKNFVTNMEKMIELVKSTKLNSATFAVDVKPAE